MLPSGIVSFLFTDIEGSTRLWESCPEAMQAALKRHDELLHQAVLSHGGAIVKTTGDGLHAVFPSTAQAVEATLAGQQAFTREPWASLGLQTGPLRIRMALHTGEAELRAGDYYGPAVNRSARLMSVAHGGQILLSEVTAGLVRENLPKGASLVDLGEHRLRDLTLPERVFQLTAPDLLSDFPPLRSLAVYPHNLPVQLTSFIGREREMAEVKRLLAAARLLTLTGTGGTGKTRLSLQAAAEMLDQFPDGVWLVELARLSDPALLIQSVAAALQAREQQGKPLLETLVDYLRFKDLLLLLDNCEHLVAACAQLAEHLLQLCPRLKILASGREALAVPGEVIYQVPSLSVPDPRYLPPVDSLLQYESVRLFVERAQAALLSFQLAQSNASAVVEICQRLDGIPLAIELAAARVRVLPVEQIDARLKDRFRLLTGGSRTALPRQQTLQALIDWSWDLLSEPERCLLRRLSVFAGGWTLEAAEAITALEEGDAVLFQPMDVLDLLTQLINKSLVMAGHESQGEGRYYLLESIRHYARDRLLESGETARVRDRHAAFFFELAMEAESQLTGPDMKSWLDRLEADQDNLRLVLDWYLDSQPERAIRMAVAFEIPWARRAFWSEARRWLEQAIERVRRLPEAEGEAARTRQLYLARALNSLGSLAASQGDNQATRSAAEEGAALARQAGDPKALAYALGLLGLACVFLNDPQAALQAMEESVTISRQHGYDWELSQGLSVWSLLLAYLGDYDKAQATQEESVLAARRSGNPWALAMATFNAGNLAAVRGVAQEAQHYYEQSIALFHDLGDRYFENIGRSDLAHLLRRQGAYDQALTIYRETILVWQEIGNRAAIAHQLESFAFTAAVLGQTGRAARLLGAADAMRQETDSIRRPDESQEFEDTKASLESELGEAFAAAWAAGLALPLDAAVGEALEVEG